VQPRALHFSVAATTFLVQLPPAPPITCVHVTFRGSNVEDGCGRGKIFQKTIIYDVVIGKIHTMHDIKGGSLFP